MRYGAGTRAFMLAVGILFALTFGFVGGFVLRAVGTAKSAGSALGTMVLAGLVLAPAVYGLVLAWRGLRGYWRPRSWTHRLALGVGVVLAAASLAAVPSTIIRLFRTDHLSMLRGGLHSVGGLDWYFSLMILTAPIQLAAHEMGHVLAGRSVGFECGRRRSVSIQVGPLCLDRPLRAWRVTWQPLAFGFGGRATMLFHGRQDLPRRSAMFAAGGPAANLLLAAFSGLISAAVRPTSALAALEVPDPRLAFGGREAHHQALAVRATLGRKLLRVRTGSGKAGEDLVIPAHEAIRARCWAGVTRGEVLREGGSKEGAAWRLRT
jgi:hypothetical protein